MKNFTSLLSLLSLSLILACTGPVGPAGAPGVQIYSSTSSIFADEFVALDEFVSVNEFSWDLLDEETVDEGLVMGYLQFEGTTSWHALPFSVPFENDVVFLRYEFDINSFDLILEGEVANNNQVNADLFDGDILRVVAIPPSLIIRGKGLDYKNYEDVAKAYNLPT